MLLYTESECIEMKFIGGDQIFAFKKLFDDGGMLARNCAIEFKGKQFVVGTNDIYVHDTSTKYSVATDAVQERLFDEIGSTNTENVKLFHNEIDSEIWVMYSEANVQDNTIFPLNRAAVFQYENNTWTFFSLPNVSGVDLGVRPPNDVENFTRWDDEETTNVSWDSVITPWSGRNSGFGNQAIVFSSYDQKFFLGDYAQQTDTIEQHVDRFVEKFGVDLSQVAGSEVDRWVHVNRILPIITTTENSSVRFLISGSETQHLAPSFFNEDGTVADGVDEYIFTPDSDYKVDCRQSWSYIAVRLEFLDPEPYQLSQMNFEVTKRGRR
jgi:hypothetical protein